MRRTLFVVLAVLVLLGVMAPPAAWAQVTPKVTINGFIDNYTSASVNLDDNNYGRTGDREWSTHTRSRLFITGEVGKAKGVIGLEFDHAWGQVGATDTNTENANTIQRASTNNAFDLGIDNRGGIELKWLYTEFPVPLIPWPTVMTLGGQPFNTTYKLATLATTDFGGLNLRTTFTPNVKWNFLYAQIEENLTGNRPLGAPSGLGACATPGTSCGRGEDFAIITSVEVTPMKGLDIRPIYSYFHATGVTNVSSRSAPGGIGGTVTFTRVTAQATPMHDEHRHTFGVDARWRSGPWSIEPTIFWQLGTRDGDNPFEGPGNANAIREADIDAWLLDIVGQYRMGPWEFSARYLYTSGNRPKDQLTKDVNYYQPIATDGAYWGGWGDIFGPGQVDNFGGGMGATAFWIGFERYGRQAFAVGVKYSVTPNLDLDLVVSPNWTARSVDTDGTQAASGFGDIPALGAITCATHSANSAASPRGAGCDGDESYLGTDLSAKIVWRLADNVQFRLGFAYLFAGSALDISERRNGILTKREAQDGYYGAAMVGYRF